MRIVGVLVCLVFFAKCYSYFDVKVSDKPISENVIQDNLLKKNIALIGFNSYEYYEEVFETGKVPQNAHVSGRNYESSFSRRYKYRVAVSVKNDNLVGKFGIGNDISRFPVIGYQDDSLNYYLMQNFLAMENEYVLRTKQYSLLESDKLYDKYGRFYNRGIDYYVLMINYPLFQRSNISGFFCNLAPILYHFSL